MRKALDLKEDEIKEVTQKGQEPRHGGFTSSNTEVSDLRYFGEVIERFIRFLNPDDNPVPTPETEKGAV